MPSYELPPQSLHFTGRKRELRALSRRINGPTLPVPIVIMGEPGIGKSALVNELVRQNTNRKALWIRATEIRALGEDYLIKDLALGAETSGATIVLDGVDEIGGFLYQLLEMRIHTCLITSRGFYQYYHGEYETLDLLGLSDGEGVAFLSKMAPTRFDARRLTALVQKVRGNPLSLILIAQLLGHRTIEQVDRQLDGLWDELVISKLQSERIVRVIAPHILLANDALIYELKRTPERLHYISPRKFEELIAELLDGMGWEVKLTPKAKDGGHDILALLDTGIGKFLTLVEAKHYNPNRPVEVSLVRQLFGTFVDRGANSAMLVTSSRFTKGARDFQQKHEYQLSLADYGNVLSWINNYKLRQKKS